MKPDRLLIDSLSVVLADGNQYMRKLMRMMLINIGVKTIYEAVDGVAALEIIRNANPALAILDWGLPIMSGTQVMKVIRSPGVFPKPELPIILVSGYADRLRVSAAQRLGAHEFIVKPTSPHVLQRHILSIFVHPRPMVRIGDHYLPKPRGERGQSEEKT